MSNESPEKLKENNIQYQKSSVEKIQPEDSLIEANNNDSKDEIKNVNSNTSSKTPQLKAKKISEFFRTNLSIKNENSLNLFAKEAIREEPIISKLTSEKENETINPDLDKTDSSPHHKRSRSN